MTIIFSDNKEFKRIFELLQQEGFIVNSFKDDYEGHPNTEVIMQKDNIQIELTDLSFKDVRNDNEQRGNKDKNNFFNKKDDTKTFIWDERKEDAQAFLTRMKKEILDKIGKDVLRHKRKKVKQVFFNQLGELIKQDGEK